jgi:hypothetical protein
VKNASVQKVCIVALFSSPPTPLIYHSVSLDDDERSLCSIELPELRERRKVCPCHLPFCWSHSTCFFRAQFSFSILFKKFILPCTKRSCE